MDVFEIREYEMTCFDRGAQSLGLFCRVFNRFLKLKQLSSGYSSWVQSEDDKEKFIENYWRAEGISLGKASISKNAEHRTLAKVKLISMGCKWAQNQNKTQTPL